MMISLQTIIKIIQIDKNKKGIFKKAIKIEIIKALSINGSIILPNSV